MVKIKVLLVCVLCLAYSAASIDIPNLDLRQVSRDEGLAQWVRAQESIVGTLYYQYYDQAQFALKLEQGKRLDQLANGEELTALESTLHYSPLGTRSVNVFVGNIEKDETGWIPYHLSPDKSIYLFDTDSSNGWPILELGPSSRLYSVGWVDDSTLVALGSVPDLRTDRLNAWRVSVEFPKVKRERYLGPPVSEQQTTILDGKWHRWLQYRYPANTWWRVGSGDQNGEN